MQNLAQNTWEISSDFTDDLRIFEVVTLLRLEICWMQKSWRDDAIDQKFELSTIYDPRCGQARDCTIVTAKRNAVWVNWCTLQINCGARWSFLRSWNSLVFDCRQTLSRTQVAPYLWWYRYLRLKWHFVSWILMLKVFHLVVPLDFSCTVVPVFCSIVDKDCLVHKLLPICSDTDVWGWADTLYVQYMCWMCFSPYQ